jgi:hypothetical protein
LLALLPILALMPYHQSQGPLPRGGEVERNPPQYVGQSDQQNANASHGASQKTSVVEGRDAIDGKEETPESERENYTQPPRDWWIIGLTGGLVFASFLLFFVGLWQAKITRDTARKQLRAYLNIGEATIINFDTQRPIVQVMVKNFGQTPAYQVKILQQVNAQFPANRPLPVLDPKDEEWHGVLAPGAHFVVMWPLDDPPIPDDRKQMIRRGVGAIYAHGRVTYEDAFGTEQWLIFKLEYGGPSEIHQAGNLATCKDGNDAS